jgi:integrase
VKITKRADGTFYTTLQVAGTRKSIYGKTEREVKKKYEEQMKRLYQGTGQLTSSGTKTVSDLLEAWLKVIKPTAKPKHVSTAEGVFKRYVRERIGHLRLSRVRTIHIQALITELEERKLRRVPSQTFSILKRVFAVAMQWGWIDRNPCTGVVISTYRPTRKGVWTHAEMQMFLNGIHDIKHGTLLAFILTTGCRVSDAVGLTWACVDFASGEARFERAVHRIGGKWVVTLPKTAAGERKLLLDPDVLVHLQSMRDAIGEIAEGDEGAQVVFRAERSTFLHERLILDAVGARCKKLGLPRMVVHGLRHQNASYLLSMGVALPTVSKRLGHSQVTTTANIYSHALSEDETKAATAFQSTASLG